VRLFSRSSRALVKARPANPAPHRAPWRAGPGAGAAGSGRRVTGIRRVASHPVGPAPPSRCRQEPSPAGPNALASRPRPDSRDHSTGIRRGPRSPRTKVPGPWRKYVRRRSEGVFMRGFRYSDGSIPRGAGRRTWARRLPTCKFLLVSVQSRMILDRLERAERPARRFRASPCKQI